MKFNKILLAPLLLLTACELTRPYDEGIFPLAPPVLVCFARIENDRPVSAYLFPTVQALDTSAANFISDAVVELYKDGGFLEELQFEEDQYVSAPATLGAPGSQYQLKVRHNDYPDLVSEVVLLPPPVDVFDYTVNYNEPASQYNISLSFSHTGQDAASYGVFADLYADGQLVRERVRTALSGSEPFIENDTVRFNLIVPAQVTRFEDFVPVDTFSIDSAAVFIRVVSEEYNAYRASAPDDEIGGFFPPKDDLFTNFEGGYGVLFTVSSGTVGIRF